MMVRAVPFVLSHASLSPVFMEMIEQLDRLKSATLDRRRGELIQLSCKRAVKAGDRLSGDEIQALLDEMARTQRAAHLPSWAAGDACVPDERNRTHVQATAVIKTAAIRLF
jgi:DNA mismatch repair ATPase MutL